MDSNQNVFERISETNKRVQSHKSRVLIFLLSLIPIGLHQYYLNNPIRGIGQTALGIGFVLFVPAPFLPILMPILMAYLTGEGLTYLLWYDVKDGNDFRLYDRENPPKPKKRKAIIFAFLLPFGLHHIYRGNLVRGRIEWAIFILPLLIKLVYLVLPVFNLDWNVVISMIIVVVVINWKEGFWLWLKT